ncbi:MAG TPA: hypothetical protein VFZ09_00850 [Archangium sp.]|nr:hypothetical protein [Archangium sp.]HEX5744755.1 hypothetical protein [Archangium sp.]
MKGPEPELHALMEREWLDGSLPLDILERRVDAWVERSRAGTA